MKKIERLLIFLGIGCWIFAFIVAALLWFEEVRQFGNRVEKLVEMVSISLTVLGSSLFLAGKGVAILTKKQKKTRRKRKTLRAHPATLSETRAAVPQQVFSVLVIPAVIPKQQQESIDQDWTSLLERVRSEIDRVQGEVKESLENEFADLLAEEKPGRKARKAWHLLFKIQKIREAISQEPVEIGEGIPISDPRPPMLQPPSLEQVLKALLPIDEYVPSDLNPKIVRKVILAFLRPGHEVPFVEASFTSLEDLLKHMREVPRDEAEKIFRWMRGMGILMERRPHRKAGRTFVSLKIHAKDVGSPGREIIQIIARAAYEKARMG